MTPTITARLANVEDGYAEVLDAATGDVLGHVHREIFPTTMWYAQRLVGRGPRTVEVGRYFTRAEAVEDIRARAERTAIRHAGAIR